MQALLEEHLPRLGAATTEVAPGRDARGSLSRRRGVSRGAPVGVR